jgi:hypothetical protein
MYSVSVRWGRLFDNRPSAELVDNLEGTSRSAATKSALDVMLCQDYSFSYRALQAIY